MKTMQIMGKLLENSEHERGFIIMKKSRKIIALLVAMVLCLGVLTSGVGAYNAPDATPKMLYQTISDKTGISASGDAAVKAGYITTEEKQFFDQYKCVTAVVAWRILFQLYGINYYTADYYPDTSPMADCTGVYADASVAAILLRLAVPDAQANLRLSETEYKKLVYALDHEQYQALPDPVAPGTSTAQPPAVSPPSTPPVTTAPAITPANPPATSSNAPTWGIIGKPDTNDISADMLISKRVYDIDAYNEYYNIVLAALQALPSSWINDFYNSGWKIAFKWQSSGPNSTIAKKLDGVTGLTSYTDKTIYIGNYTAKTITHEFAHYAARRIGWDVKYLQWYFDTEAANVAKILPKYAQTKPAEYFADYVAYWIVYPDNCRDLERNAPYTAARVKDLINDYDALLAAATA